MNILQVSLVIFANHSLCGRNIVTKIFWYLNLVEMHISIEINSRVFLTILNNTERLITFWYLNSIEMHISIEIDSRVFLAILNNTERLITYYIFVSVES